jgi:hypothetical protein
MLAEIRPTFARSHRSYIVTVPRGQDGNERRISGTRCCSKLCFRRQQPGLKPSSNTSRASNMRAFKVRSRTATEVAHFGISPLSTAGVVPGLRPHNPFPDGKHLRLLCTQKTQVILAGSWGLRRPLVRPQDNPQMLRCGIAESV